MKSPRRNHRFRIVAALVVAVVLVAGPASAASDSDGSRATEAGVTARYGDRLIDLAQSWGGARACVVWPDKLDVPECFDTETQMNRRIAELEAELAPASVGGWSGTAATSGSSCASYLRLYDGTWLAVLSCICGDVGSGSTWPTTGSISEPPRIGSGPVRHGSRIGVTEAGLGIRHR